MTDFKHQTFDIIRQFTGNENLITVNVAYVDFVKDLECGLFLSQLIYWSDRGTRKDGFIYKADKEWYDELRLSKYAVGKSKKKLVEMGLLETKIKKANGNPTTHYKLNKEEFVKQFTSFLRNQAKESSISQEGNNENNNSLTEITSKITSEKKTHGTECDSARGFSFSEYQKHFPFIDPAAIECVEYYLSLYQEYRGEEHPRLKEEQWEHIANNLFYIVNEDYGIDYEMHGNETGMKDMMEQHFKTKYKNCDYNILHFMSNGIRVRRMYEVAY